MIDVVFADVSAVVEVLDLESVLACLVADMVVGDGVESTEPVPRLGGRRWDVVHVGGGEV